jgi:hypothetical protein
LVDNGWRREDAEQLAKILSSNNLPSEFRVVAASISFDGEGGTGFSIGIDARNYVRARADPSDLSNTRAIGAPAEGEEAPPRSYTTEEIGWDLEAEEEAPGRSYTDKDISFEEEEELGEEPDLPIADISLTTTSGTS